MDKSLMPKTKHDHKWTDKLKVIIFALLMLAPLFSVLVKCIYTLNPNAKDSYYGATINEEQTINVDYTDLKIDQEYIFNNPITSEKPNERIEGDLYTHQTKNINGFNNNIDLTNTYRVHFYLTTSWNTFIFFDINNQEITSAILSSTVMEFSFIFKGITPEGYIGFEYANYFYKIEYNKYSYLDNVFYYSVNQIKEDNLFKWVDNTIVYNGLNAMNTGFGLESNHVLTYLLAYWTILTAIYIVIDIILFLFTKLTHLLQ